MEQFYQILCTELCSIRIKKLISTSYAVESKTYKHYQPSLFETESPL